MKNTYLKFVELVKKEESFVVVTILSKSGSAPRSEGTKMIVRKDGAIIGTIGGGKLEALCIDYSKGMFEKMGFEIKKFSLTNRDASLEGMVCGGDLEVLIEFINSSNERVINFSTKIEEIINEKKSFIIVSEIMDGAKELKKWIVTGNNIIGEESEEIKELVAKGILDKINSIELIENESKKLLIEKFQNKEKVFIFGGGHVSEKLSYLTTFTDFYTVVLDDREEFANKSRFGHVDEVILVESFNKPLEKIEIDDSSYVVIVTRGHSFDKEVLAEVLKTNAYYIGMIGSKKKRETIYNQLLSTGYTEEDLKKVYSPIGLSINAETPAEIAVSIVGEMIKVRRNG